MATTTMNSPLCSCVQFLFYAVLHVLLAFSSRPTEPDPMQDFCVADLKSKIFVNGFPCVPASNVSTEDFFYDGLGQEGYTSNVFGSNVTSANVLAFPALNTLGLSLNRLDLAPGGLYLPHSHPRASEAGVVTQGKILVGFVTTANVLHSKVLTAGQVYVIPKGLVHFQLNVGKGKATIFASFNSQLPGADVIPSILFASKPSIPDQVLAKAFQVDVDVVEAIKSQFVS